MRTIIQDYNIDEVYEELDRVATLPPKQFPPEALRDFENYFHEKCRKSYELVEKTKAIIPGGVQHNLSLNHPFPLVVEKAEGAYLWDIDGNRYTDFLQAGGPTVLGSNYAPVREKVIELLNSCGPVTGLLHEYEFKLAELVHRHMPSVEMFRMLASGTEAVMASFRIARAATSHAKVIKTGGGYHGWSDQAIYDIRAAGTRGSYATGVPEASYQDTQAVAVNDLEGLESLMKSNDEGNAGGTACVILEPLGPESGVRPCKIEYLRGVRELCDKYGALLIFDEVVTGFRIGMGGAQAYFGIEADLTIFGKVLTGGYPAAGAVGGKQQYMKHLAPGLGDSGKKVMVGGTLSANPLSCCAGYHTILEMERTDAPYKAAKAGDRLCTGIKKIRDKYDLPFAVFNQGSIVHLDAVGILNYTITPENAQEIIQESVRRGKNFNEMGMALMSSGIVTIAASRMYTSLADTDEIIDDAIGRIDYLFSRFN